MVGIFTGFYFISYCLSKEGRVFAKNIVMTVLRFAMATVIAILCACIVLIPVYNSLKLGKFEFDNRTRVLRVSWMRSE